MIPAMISTTPTARMKTGTLTGITFVAIGLRYMPQSASTLKNLSVPAMIGPRPKPRRRAHQAVLSRESKSVISCLLYKKSERGGGGYREFPKPHADFLGPTGNLFAGRHSILWGSYGNP